MKSLVPAALFSAAILLLSEGARAGSRRFTYLYETTTHPKGAIEIENFATWKTNRVGDRETDTFDFRHEIEWGVTDKLQLGLYVADWTYTNKKGEKGATYNATALEARYNLTNPNVAPFGSALYGEVKLGDHKFELESKLLLQKNFGPLILAYNVGLEAEWEGSKLSNLDERTGEFQQVAGLSYELTPQLCLGAEVLHEVEWPEWSKPEPSRVFAGPNISIRYKEVWATITPLFQLTDREGEPDFQTRIIVGFDL